MGCGAAEASSIDRVGDAKEEASIGSTCSVAAAVWIVRTDGVAEAALIGRVDNAVEFNVIFVFVETNNMHSS